jgi:hypothetical protein
MIYGTQGMVRIDPAVSPLILCDRLLTLAEDVDRAGMRGAAEHLLTLASQVLQPKRPGRGECRTRA